MSTPRRILIRAGHVVAFDGRGHRLLRDGVVVLEGDASSPSGRPSRAASTRPSTPATGC